MNPSKKNKLFEKYMAGDISQDEMHELNQYALEDDFLFEALEGASGFEESNPSAVQELNNRLKGKEKKKRSPLYIWMSAAAAVAILVVAIMFIPDLKNETMSEVVIESVEESASDKVDEMSAIALEEVAQSEANEAETEITRPAPTAKTRPSQPPANHNNAGQSNDAVNLSQDQFSSKVELDDKVAERKIAPLENISLAEIELENIEDEQVTIEIAEAPPAVSKDREEEASPPKPVASSLRLKKELKRNAFQNAESEKAAVSSNVADGISIPSLNVQYNDPSIALKFQDYASENFDKEGFPERLQVEMTINNNQEATEIDIKTSLTSAQTEKIIQLVESFKEWGEAGNKTLQITFTN